MTYRKVRRLGAGYFGEVWLEEDTALNRLCAAKYLNPDVLLANHNPFAEAQTMVSVEHENIVQVYSADTSGDRPVIRMEYLREGSVESVYAGKPVPVLDAIALLEEACRGIEFLHSKGVLHRDIKPANLLLNGPKRVKVSDFGLACHADSTTMAPPWSYTAHLPPESINAATGIEDFTGDVYALGVTAYRLFNGDDRFAEIRGYAESTPNAVFEATHHRNGSWQPYVHQALRNVLRKSVHRNKASRYASASKFRHALEKVRPAVSWRPGEDDRAWCGVSVDGRTKWKALLTLLPNGAHRFRVEKQVGGNQWRNVSRHGLETMTQSDIKKHMESAFESIASTGR